MAPKRARETREPIFGTDDVVVFTKPEHQETYTNLVSFTMPCTEYFAESMLKGLGLKEDIEWMASNIGWTQFLTMKEPTYRSLTFEFLATLEVMGELLTFRLGNQDRELTVAQFNTIFGFSSGGLRSEFDHGVSLSQFWRKIADCPRIAFHPGRSRAVDMYNPSFRLMQKFVAQTVFGRAAHTVCYGELLFLYAMTHKLKLDTGAFILRHMAEVKSINDKGDHTNSVYVGGMITSIARYFNIDFGSLQSLEADLIDTHTCVSMHMIFKRGSLMYLRLPISTKPWLLPDKAHTTVMEPANWKSTFEDFDFENYDFMGEIVAGRKAQWKTTKAWLKRYKFKYIKTTPFDYNIVDNDEAQADSGDCNVPDSDPETDPNEGDPTVQSVVDRLERVERQLEHLNKMEDMMQHMYDWHVKKGHFQAAPPG